MNKTTLTEQETQEHIKVIDLSLLKSFSVKGAVEHLKKLSSEYEVLQINKDFSQDSYFNKLVFNETFFMTDLKNYAVKKEVDKLKNLKKEICDLKQKIAKQNMKQYKEELKQKVKRIKETSLKLKRKISYYNKEQECINLNRKGFIIGKPNQTPLNTSELIIKDIETFNSVFGFD